MTEARRRSDDPRRVNPGRAARSAGAAVIGALAAVVVGISAASGSTDATGVGVARCAAGTVDAVIAGKRVCLRRGQRCSKRLDRQYHRYGFHCHTGRLTGGPEPKPPKPPPAGKVVATISAPSVGGIAVGGGAVWVANLNPLTITRIDPETNAVAATIPLGEPDFLFGPTRLAYGHGSLWVLEGKSSNVLRIDPETNLVSTTIPLGTPTQGSTAPLGIVVTPDAVWVANRWGSEDAPDGSVVRIDPTTNRIVATIGLGASPDHSGPTNLTVGSGGVWVGVPSAKSVVRIDPASDSVVATIPGFTCADGGLATDGSSVWVADCSTVRRIDAGSNTIAKTIPIPGATGSGVRAIALEFGSVWVQAGPLVRLDPASGAVVGVLPLGVGWIECEYSIAFGFGSVWVRQLDEVVRIQP